MDINNLIIGEELDASLETTLAIEQFLSENYRFRRNLLNGKVELTAIRQYPLLTIISAGAPSLRKRSTV